MNSYGFDQKSRKKHLNKRTRVEKKEIQKMSQKLLFWSSLKNKILGIVKKSDDHQKISQLKNKISKF